MADYKHLEVEKKWQQYWEENKTFKADQESEKPKYYVLDMFPYPSGAGLHVGHPEGYTATDIISRLRRRQGYNVLHPMGWDAFGLPAENFAIKTGIHPKVSTKQNIETFTGQIKSLGFSYDWDREIDTTDPDYYKWSQWIFLKLFEKGLAYEKEMVMSWCPSCKIVAANEEVENGVHERCGHPVEKREMKQWMLKITEYADRLLDDLDTLDWTDAIKSMQRDWIGKSYGAEVDFAVDGIEETMTVYTTRPDTLFGCTYMVLAPEHPLVEKVTSVEQKAEVEAYVQAATQKSERERKQDEKEKTGVFTGGYAINPVNGEKVQIWVADYVLIGYGTGAIMAVPAHDERDFEFAEKFGIEMIDVVEGEAKEGEIVTTGVAKNSGFLDGLTTEDAKEKMIDWLEGEKKGTRQTNYKLRDWVFTRQRYWGEPIPLVHCDDCGIVPIPESELPLELPETANYEPTEDGQSPLAAIEDWVNTSCPKCGKAAKRETSTMPNWAGSSWYWLRFMDPKNDQAAVGEAAEKYWQQVDLYVGGAEHAVLHLLYGRFWHKFLYDLGLVTTIEPFQKLVNQGMILAFSYKNENGKYYHPDDVKEEGGKFFAKENGEELSRQIEKMSKSKLNVVNPDDVVQEHGADTLRLYEMFMGQFDQTVVWDVNGVTGVRRFLDKVWKLREKVDFKEKKAIIIHGFESACDSHWIPEVREKLIEKGYYVQTPSMPNPGKPNYQEWKKVIGTLDINENSVLVGHSLGGGFLPRYLQERGVKIKKLVLVAPTYTSKNPAIDEEFGKDFDAEVVKGLAEEIVLLHSDEDPYITQDAFTRYESELSPQKVFVEGGEHLSSSQLEKGRDAVLGVFADEEAKVCDLERALHKTIKKVTEDTEGFKFNTAISAMMVLVNDFGKLDSIPVNLFEDLLFILNPYAPHITEELWQSLGHVSTLTFKPWPRYNEELCKDDTITLAVQINGKVRDQIEVAADASKEDVLAAAKASKKVQKFIEGGLKKEIYVPGKLVSLVV